MIIINSSRYCISKRYAQLIVLVVFVFTIGIITRFNNEVMLVRYKIYQTIEKLWPTLNDSHELDMQYRALHEDIIACYPDYDKMNDFEKVNSLREYTFVNSVFANGEDALLNWVEYLEEGRIVDAKAQALKFFSLLKKPVGGGLL